MKRARPFIISLMAVAAITQHPSCQRYDRHWIGLESDASYHVAFMRFDPDSIHYLLSGVTSKIQSSHGSLAMSDAEGELQFYTNGNVVVSWDHHIMQGGKGFNQGASSDDYLYNPPWQTEPDTLLNSSYNPYTYRIIPDAYDAHTYYMIHAFVTEIADCKYFNVPKMQISKIDMAANGGKGKVIYKNRYFDEELMAAGFALVRHGNGKDWWVVLRKQDGLAYKSILLQRDSVVQVVHSTIPGLSSDWFSWNDCAQASGCLLEVSDDGSRLLDKFGEDWAKLLAFDRCSGSVSLLDTFRLGITPLVTSGGVVIDCDIYTLKFSPSGRYMYGAGYAEFAQWNLEAANIRASKVKLGGVPWWLDEEQNVVEGIPGGFTVFATGPDGKMYNLLRTSHSVIEHPDEKGAASGLCLAADNPPSCLGDNVPYWLYSDRHPNFRLGALEGSACDSILSNVPSPAPNSGYRVAVSPSAAAVQAQVEITLPSYSGSSAEIQVVDMLGRSVYQHRFAPFAYLHSLEVQGWTPGVYNIVLLDKGRWKAVTRLVVVR